jgi:hypothetical protein
MFIMGENSKIRKRQQRYRKSGGRGNGNLFPVGSPHPEKENEVVFPVYCNEEELHNNLATFLTQTFR